MFPEQEDGGARQDAAGSAEQDAEGRCRKQIGGLPEVAVLLAPGPTLRSDLLPFSAAIRSLQRQKRLWVLGVGDAYRVFDTPDVLYHCDVRWWDHHRDIGVSGRSWYCDELDKMSERTDLLKLKKGAHHGLEKDWPVVAMGGNSGHQAVNLAYHLGARCVALVGYNMQRVDGRMHFFGDHPERLWSDSPYDYFVSMFTLSAPVFAESGLRVFNATSFSALKMFQGIQLGCFLERFT